MQLLILCDTFPPRVNSGAKQLGYLVEELLLLGNTVTVVCPNVETVETHDPTKLKVLGTKYFNSKSKIKFFRLMLECLLPIVAIFKLIWSPPRQVNGVICYSPSIFWAPVVLYLKLRYRCKAYLIIRDIFPDWALETGVIRNKFVFYILKLVAYLQFLVSDRIGVQSGGNLSYLEQRYNVCSDKIEVLENWIGVDKKTTDISPLHECIRDKFVFIHAGNDGHAQNLSLIVRAANLLKDDCDIIFLLIGGGDLNTQTAKLIFELDATNVLLRDYVPEEELQGLLAHCDVGIVSLNPKIRSHNIPGKFLNYLRNEMGVLACINEGNDLQFLIEKECLGVTYLGDDASRLSDLLKVMISEREKLENYKKNAFRVYREKYSPSLPAKRIISFFRCPKNKTIVC